MNKENKAERRLIERWRGGVGVSSRLDLGRGSPKQQKDLAKTAFPKLINDKALGSFRMSAGTNDRKTPRPVVRQKEVDGEGDFSLEPLGKG